MFSKSGILIIEDNPTEALAIRKAFEDAEIKNPLTIGSSEEAFAFLNAQAAHSERFEQPQPCLVVLSLNLTKADGFETLRQIRSHPVYKRIPVVALSSSSDPDHVNRAYDLGANSCLLKPLAYPDLMQIVKSINGYWVILVQKPQF